MKYKLLILFTMFFLIVVPVTSQSKHIISKNKRQNTISQFYQQFASRIDNVINACIFTNRISNSILIEYCIKVLKKSDLPHDEWKGYLNITGACGNEGLRTLFSLSGEILSGKRMDNYDWDYRTVLYEHCDKYPEVISQFLMDRNIPDSDHWDMVNAIRPGNVLCASDITHKFYPALAFILFNDYPKDIQRQAISCLIRPPDYHEIGFYQKCFFENPAALEKTLYRLVQDKQFHSVVVIWLALLKSKRSIPFIIPFLKSNQENRDFKTVSEVYKETYLKTMKIIKDIEFNDHSKFKDPKLLELYMLYGESLDFYKNYTEDKKSGMIIINHKNIGMYGSGIAYRALKIISGKDFGYDQNKWVKWWNEEAKGE